MFFQLKNIMCLVFMVLFASPVFSDSLEVPFETFENNELYDQQNVIHHFTHYSYDLANHCQNFTCAHTYQDSNLDNINDKKALKFSMNIDFASIITKTAPIYQVNNLSRPASLGQSLLQEPGELSEYSIGLNLSLSF